MSNINVLIADSNTTNTAFLSRALRKSNKVKLLPPMVGGESVVSFMQKNPDSEIDIALVGADLGDMEGSEILTKIVENSPNTKVVMVLPLDEKAAKNGLKMLDLGATDYVIKLAEDKDVNELKAFRDELLDKVLELGNIRVRNAQPGTPSLPTQQNSDNDSIDYAKPSKDIVMKPAPSAFFPEVIAIASSTGGPNILTKIIEGLKGKTINLPIFITQHMPRDFTALLAEQLAIASGFKCVEAKHKMHVRDNEIYIAPGDYHMTVENHDNGRLIHLNQDAPENYCRPAADPMFRSLAESYGASKMLCLVLTGMGKDGLEGCKTISEEGGVIIAQDFESSAVWGMPGAVANAGICTELLPPEEIVRSLQKLSGGKIS